MSLTDLACSASKSGEVTSVWRYDDADTYVVQSGSVHLSFFEDDLSSLFNVTLYRFT